MNNIHSRDGSNCELLLCLLIFYSKFTLSNIVFLLKSTIWRGLTIENNRFLKGNPDHFDRGSSLYKKEPLTNMIKDSPY